MNADAAAVGQIVIVADDCLEEVLVFAKHFRHVGDCANVRHCCHQAAFDCVVSTGTQFQGSNASRRLIL